MLDFSVLIGKFVFIVLIFVIISAGFITDILSCQTRQWLRSSMFARHIVGIIMVFAFIMFEGGWDFNSKREFAEPNNWLSGNTLHTLAFACLLYFVFFISSKSQLIPNLLFYGIILTIYIVNTYREYIFARKEINKAENAHILQVEKTLLWGAGIVLVYGLIEYMRYQMKQRGAKFNWVTFFVGVPKCGFESRR